MKIRIENKLGIPIFVKYTLYNEVEANAFVGNIVAIQFSFEKFGDDPAAAHSKKLEPNSEWRSELSTSNGKKIRICINKVCIERIASVYGGKMNGTQHLIIATDTASQN